MLEESGAVVALVAVRAVSDVVDPDDNAWDFSSMHEQEIPRLHERGEGRQHG